MSKVIIDYSDIRTASGRAKTISLYYGEMAEGIEKQVAQKLQKLDGDDSAGNIGHAQGLLTSKMKTLNLKKDYYSTLSASISTMADNMEDHEDKVVSDICTHASDALDLKNQSKWQSVAQWAYGTFCVDFLNWNPITRGIGNAAKKGFDWLQDKATTVENWFKRGGGRYALEALLDVLAVGGSIWGTIGAITLAVGTGGAATPLAIAAVASTIGTVMTVGDAATSTYNKYKARDIYRDTEDPGMARYYASVGGVKDAVDKYDMGGQTANMLMSAVGTGYDLTHTAADITALATGLVGKAGLTGVRHTNAVTGKVTLETVYDPSKVKTNLPNMLREKLGFRNKAGKWTFDIKNLFTTKGPKTGTTARADILVKNAQTDVMGHDLYKIMKDSKKVLGVPGKVNSTIKNFNQVFAEDSSAYDRTKGVLKLMGSTSFQISSPISDFNNTVIKIADTVIDLAS